MITVGVREHGASANESAMPGTTLARRHRVRPRRAFAKQAICAFTAATFAFAPDLAGAASLLDGINGSWSGRGRVTFEGGNGENLSCRAYYSTSGAILTLVIRCASPSYKTEIRSKLQIDNGTLTGQWEERNYNAVGSASGVVSGNRIALRISGAIDGHLSIDQTGVRQSVNISTSGSGLSSVKIGFSKS